MNYEIDPRIVLSLDAGGTNFVFTAIRGNREIVSPLTLPSLAHDLQQSLDQIIQGFRAVLAQLPGPPAAISFAFPGPSDYPGGIIGDLGNLPGYRGGVALGPMLEGLFGLPVFINNDGDLYAYGEALAGYLPHINGLLEKSGSPKRFSVIVGFTLGTGFGAGIVRNGNLFLGDNSNTAEVYLLRNRVNPGTNAEEGVSIRAVRRVYGEVTGLKGEEIPTPKDIKEIAEGRLPGNREAALEAYRQLGVVLGDVIANVLTLADGLAVLGGGLAGAYSLFAPAMIAEMRGTYTSYTGRTYPRLAQQVFDLENPEELEIFLKGSSRIIPVPGTGRQISYDPMQRVGVGLTRLGTSKAVALGAYAFALHELDSRE